MAKKKKKTTIDEDIANLGRRREQLKNFGGEAKKDKGGGGCFIGAMKSCDSHPGHVRSEGGVTYKKQGGKEIVRGKIRRPKAKKAPKRYRINY